MNPWLSRLSHRKRALRALRTARAGGVALCLIFLSAAPAFAEGEHRFDLPDWKLTLSDTPANAAPETDDSGWTPLQLPGNLSSLGARPNRAVWLRTEVNLAPPANANLALMLGAVYDSDQVYLNGELIGSGRALGIEGYGRPRIYPLPARLLQTGRNVIAIRIIGAFPSDIGLRGAPAIDEMQNAEWTLWKGELARLVFAGLYFAIGFFFIILYFKLPALREYRWFGFLALAFGLQQFLVDEARFFLADAFLFYKLLEQLCYIATPLLYYFFHINFFKSGAIKLKLKNRSLELPVGRLGLVYAVLNGATAAAIIVLMDPVAWDRIITVWFLINLPFFIYYAADAYSRAVLRYERDAIFLSIGLTVMLAITLHFYAVERGLVDGQSYFSQGMLFFTLVLAFALTYRLIELQMEVDRRSRRLDSVNLLKDRVFNYINAFVRPPAEQIGARVRELLDGATDRRRKEAIGELEIQLDGMQATLDDILELSRLEAISEAEYLEPVNFRDFITAVIPQGVITHYIKVQPEIVLNTSLELVNSLVIRLIDFPAFKEFKHLDLIITSDLRAHVHFRFLLFHNNVRVTRRLYDVLTDLNPERGNLWVKWAIIREIIRILDGRMDVNIINRKFLRIDIDLAGEAPASATRERSGGAILVERIAEATAEPLTPELATAGIGAPRGDYGRSGAGGAVASPAAAPRFRADMTIGELAAFLRAKFLKKRS